MCISDTIFKVNGYILHFPVYTHVYSNFGFCLPFQLGSAFKGVNLLFNPIALRKAKIAG